MKLIAATALSLLIFAWPSAQVQEQQMIKITRSDMLATQQAPAENFTGS